MHKSIELPPPNDGPAVNKWLMDPSRSPRDILQFIEVTPPMNFSAHLATHVLNVRLSEIAEISTKRIVRLTVGLLLLTAGLLAFTVALYEDAHADIQRHTLTQQYESQHP
jgi:hypothetical protein